MKNVLRHNKQTVNKDICARKSFKAKKLENH